MNADEVIKRIVDLDIAVNSRRLDHAYYWPMRGLLTEQLNRVDPYLEPPAAPIAMPSPEDFTAMIADSQAWIDNLPKGTHTLDPIPTLAELEREVFPDSTAMPKGV